MWWSCRHYSRQYCSAASAVEREPMYLQQVFFFGSAGLMELHGERGVLVTDKSSLCSFREEFKKVVIDAEIYAF
ncbi:MAG: hypothetical protein ACOYNF_19000, partial [Rhodoferax sp.]